MSEFLEAVVSLAHSFAEWWMHTFDKPDAYVALFTLILAIGTLALWWSTRQLWKVTRITAEHVAVSERAHVSGGANRGTTSDGREVLVVTINNYGRTPAFIGTVAATICRENELSTFPGWVADRWEGHLFVKTWKGYVFGYTPGQPSDIILPYEPGKVIAGRIWYRDIFNRHYSIGFLLRTDNLSAVGGHPSFWEERQEQGAYP
jgi:hypothetical protein